MNDNLNELEAGTISVQRPGKRNGKMWVASGAAVVAVVVASAVAMHWGVKSAPVVAPAAPPVAISAPLQRNLDTRLGFLGQFSAVQKVELRAQVGGTLTASHFKDGDIVHKGDLLFEIDTVPYEIKLSQAMAQLESAKARLELATIELQRAEALKRTNAGSAQNVDQRAMEQRTAQAAVDGAKAQVRDAQFDLDHCPITAP